LKYKLFGFIKYKSKILIHWEYNLCGFLSHEKRKEIHYTVKKLLDDEQHYKPTINYVMEGDFIVEPKIDDTCRINGQEMICYKKVIGSDCIEFHFLTKTTSDLEVYEAFRAWEVKDED